MGGKRKGEEAKQAKKERQEKKLNKKLNQEVQKDEEICLEEILGSKLNATKTKKIEIVDCPLPRINATLVSHPDKDGLYLFGGEFDNGKEVTMYNELFYYSPKKDQWTNIETILSPTPRSSHQTVSFSQGGGQLWTFGGEYTNKTHDKYFHYNDLWCYHITKQEWELIKKPSAPSPRSGHRMVAFKKLLVIFGGFFNNEKSSQYYNDLYIFHTEDRVWMKIEPYNQQIIGAKTIPAPRSAHHFLSLNPENAHNSVDNSKLQTNKETDIISQSVLLIGGYATIKKADEKFSTGHFYSDMYRLCPEKSQLDMEMPTNWRWSFVKQSGSIPSVRCGYSMVTGYSGNRALLFGGVFDAEQTEETICGSIFYNDMYQLDMLNGRWFPFPILKRHHNDPPHQHTVPSDDITIENQIGNPLKKIKIPNKSSATEPKSSESEEENMLDSCIQLSRDAVNGDVKATPEPSTVHVRPGPRMKAHLAINKNGKCLYLLGGLYEDNKDRTYTLNDFYKLDLKKNGGGPINRYWIQIHPDQSKIEDYQWSESSSSDSDSAQNSEDENYNQNSPLLTQDGSSETE